MKYESNIYTAIIKVHENQVMQILMYLGLLVYTCFDSIKNIFWKKWKSEKVEKRSVEGWLFGIVEEVLNYCLWVELTKRIFFGKSEKVKKLKNDL